MKKIRLQAVLMVIAILGITGFQLFWLKQTYNREENALAIKADLAFRDVIQELQVIKLKLDQDTSNTTHAKVVIRDSVNQNIDIKTTDNRRGVISIINVVSRKHGDSNLPDSSTKRGVFISKDSNFFERKFDLPGNPPEDNMYLPAKNKLFRILYDVDLMQDTIKVKEISTALSRRFVKDKTDIPFSILRLDSSYRAGEPAMNEVSIGLAKPVTYKLKLGNTFPYLLKQISLPVLFSLLLLGITVISFVTIYRSLLQQKRLTDIKNEFIGNITHELKTPIATVSVAIEAMKNFNALQSPERTQEYLGIAGLELNRLSLLVDKVLRLSMFENREVELKYMPFNFAELLQEVTKSMQLQFEKASANVSTRLNGFDFTIEADRMHITSVIYNLLDNAIKYSKENPEIKIVVDSSEQDITLSIEDNGIGIDPEYQEKIFDKFFRVPHGNRHNVKGYGLGLSYAAHIIVRHQGSIEAKSDGRNGTIFIIKLPRHHAG